MPPCPPEPGPVLLAAGTVLAEQDTLLLGNGQHGALLVKQMDTVLNTATALTAPATVDSEKLSVADSTGFAAGELVLVLPGSTPRAPPPRPGRPGQWRSTPVGRGPLGARAPGVRGPRCAEPHRAAGRLLFVPGQPGDARARVHQRACAVLRARSWQAAWDGSSRRSDCLPRHWTPCSTRATDQRGRRGLPGRRLRGRPRTDHRVHAS